MTQGSSFRQYIDAGKTLIQLGEEHRTIRHAFPTVNEIIAFQFLLYWAETEKGFLHEYGMFKWEIYIDHQGLRTPTNIRHLPRGLTVLIVHYLYHQSAKVSKVTKFL